MKKSLILLAIGLGMFCLTSYSQEQQTTMEHTLMPKFGIKGGVNLTNLYVNDVSDENMKVNFHAGFYGKMPLGRGVSIQPELLYTSKGAKETYNNFFSGHGEYRFNLNYIELPLSLVFNVARNFNLHAGGYAAYLVNTNIKNLNKDNGEITQIANLNEDDFHRFDAGVLAGLGVDVENFTIGARYNYGLCEIGKSGSFAGQALKNAKNSAIQVYIGFGF